MLRAHGQGVGYARALPKEEGRPPFVITLDVGVALELYSEFTQSGGAYVPFPDPRSHRITLADLHREEIRERLRKVWLEPLALNPTRLSAKEWGAKSNFRSMIQCISSLVHPMRIVYDASAIRDFTILFIHLLVTIARLFRPGGVRSIVAESLLVKHQLLILNRSRKRAPSLKPVDRLITGLCAIFMKPNRLLRSSIVLKPSSILEFPSSFGKTRISAAFHITKSSKTAALKDPLQN